jgi:uncharacterized protein
MRTMKFKSALVLFTFVSAVATHAADSKPLRALYITGGCCHDYNNQKQIIPEGVSARANVTWTIVQEGGSGTKHKVSIYEKPNWADEYDIIVHNECFADVDEAEFVEKVLAAHRNGKPAIVIHCTMHTFRSLKSNDWREFLGVTSTHHGPQHPLDVKNLKSEHPIMKTFPAVWTTGNEELYAIDKVWPTATPLATAADKKKDATGAWVETPKQNAVVWINTYGKGRVFGTTLAHNNKTMQTEVYLDMLTRGLLWACDKLDDKGNPKAGFEAAKK